MATIHHTSTEQSKRRFVVRIAETEEENREALRQELPPSISTVPPYSFDRLTCALMHGTREQVKRFAICNGLSSVETLALLNAQRALQATDENSVGNVFDAWIDLGHDLMEMAGTSREVEFVDYADCCVEGAVHCLN